MTPTLLMLEMMISVVVGMPATSVHPTPPPACMEASDAAGRLLDLHPLWTSIAQRTNYFQEFMSRVFPIDVLKQREREQFFCMLEAVDSLEEAAAIFEDVGVFQRMLKNVYALNVVRTKVWKVLVPTWIQNPPEAIDDDDIKLLLKFGEDLEASGFTDQEPELEAFWTRIVSVTVPDLLHVTREPPSAQSLEQQCVTVTDDVRQIWIENKPDWVNPVYQLTGINMTNNRELQLFICNLMEATIRDGVDGMYDFLKENGLLQRLGRVVYNISRDDLQMMIAEVERDDSHLLHADGRVSSALRQLILSIRDMGLLNFLI